MAIIFQQRFSQLSQGQQRQFAARARQATAARSRREAQFTARLAMWRGDEFQAKLKGKIGAQLMVVGQLFRDKVVINISRPVTKLPGQRRQRRTRRGARGSTFTWVDPSSRSKPGEFPKADTSTLLRSIFSKKAGDKNTPAVRIGTNLGYGAVLELSPRLRRSFLRRTLVESRREIASILTKPYRTILGSETA